MRRLSHRDLSRSPSKSPILFPLAAALSLDTVYCETGRTVLSEVRRKLVNLRIKSDGSVRYDGAILGRAGTLASQPYATSR